MKRLLFLSLALVGILFAVTSSFPRATDAAPEWQTFSPPHWILGPIQGADGSEKTILRNLDKIAQWKIPITAFHFDAPDWMMCTGNLQFRYSDTVLDRMRAQNIRGLFWVVPLIGLECNEYQVALANDYFVKDAYGKVIVTENFTGHGSWIDFNNPAAVAYWHTLLDGLRARVGTVLGGFYTDSVRPDSRNGAVDYGEAYALDLLNYTRTYVPDGDVVFKRYGVNTPSDAWLNQYAHVAYVNDLPTNFSGMQTGIKRVFHTTPFMPLPYNELSGFNGNPPDSETYIRRMHWGAFQPVMENVPKTKQPWDAIFTPQVMQAYAYYGTLHRELEPYLHTYDQIAFEQHEPIFRDTNASRYSARLGDEFFVQYVTEYTRALAVKLPPGKWINYWNESQVFDGSQIITYPVPLGKEPIFIARGAIIPMHVSSSLTGHGTKQSANALTLNAYLYGHSQFRYHDDKNGWLTLDVSRKKQRLALCTLDHVPSEPIIWRVVSVGKKPRTVTEQNGAVGVNTAWGTSLPQFKSEGAVGASGGGWYYDASAQRLVVKISNLGADCPAP
jgi:alpha-glucosidase (family GH31 glycosyl hydrolase)